MKKDRICIYCGISFNIEGRIFSNHVRWCKQNPNDKGNKSISIALNDLHDKRLGKLSEFIVRCKCCDNEFTIKERKKQYPTKEFYFCNRICANTRTHSDKTKIKISKKVKKLWKTKRYRDSIVRNNINKNKRFSSKSEIQVSNFFKSKFPNDGWTSGGSLKIDDLLLVRDLYSKKLKVCIEYDGIWHFKDIHGQLADKQKKDAALEKWCILNGYRLIRIKDEVYLKNPSKYLDLLENSVYTDTTPLLKFYS